MARLCASLMWTRRRSSQSSNHHILNGAETGPGLRDLTLATRSVVAASRCRFQDHRACHSLPAAQDWFSTALARARVKNYARRIRSNLPLDGLLSPSTDAPNAKNILSVNDSCPEGRAIVNCVSDNSFQSSFESLSDSNILSAKSSWRSDKTAARFVRKRLGKLKAKPETDPTTSNHSTPQHCTKIISMALCINTPTRPCAARTPTALSRQLDMVRQVSWAERRRYEERV